MVDPLASLGIPPRRGAPMVAPPRAGGTPAKDAFAGLEFDALGVDVGRGSGRCVECVGGEGGGRCVRMGGGLVCRFAPPHALRVVVQTCTRSTETTS